MKKTFTINISGTLFHIEEDAYEKLQVYLIKLKSHFGNSTEAREIIADIEGRISELFSEKLQGDEKVVSLEMVEDVISTMGSPEDFEEQESPEEPITAAFKRKRRLYRSPDSRVIAGVCGGLGSYFKIDPVILRILFVLLFFANGVGLLAYIILWIAVPRAVTTSQKLEMRGEEINVSSIERSLRVQSPAEEENPVEEKPKDEIRETKAAQVKTYRKETTAVKKERDPSSDFGTMLLRAVVVLFGAFFMVTGFLGLVGLISTVVIGQSLVGSWPFAWTTDYEISALMGHLVSPTAYNLGILSLTLLIGIPLLAVFIIGSKMIFRYKTNNTAIGLGMTGIWLISLLVMLVVIAGEAGNYKSQTTLTNSETIYCESCSTLYLQLASDQYANYAEADLDLERFKVVLVDGKNVLLGQPRFDIEKSRTDDIVLVFRKRSRGKTQADANENIHEIIYNYQVNDSILIFDPWFLTGNDGQWRDQKVDIILKLPVGKSVFLSDEMVEIIYGIDNVSKTRHREMVGKYWEMQPDGLTMKELNK